jgi:hypothetical protein
MSEKNKKTYKWSKVRTLDGFVYYDLLKDSWLGFKRFKRFNVGYDWSLDANDLSKKEEEAKEKLNNHIEKLIKRGHKVIETKL